MYAVSNNYKTAAATPIQEHQLTGTIGSINFTEANIVSGTFSIQNQCSSGAGSDIQPGSVIVGELSAVFTGINLTRGQWRNKVITPTFSLKVGNSWEAVPLGVFKVKEAKHTADGVQVKAYDNMHKFDKSFKKKRFKYSGTMYQFLSDICTRCHVTLGMTQAQVQALTNGTGSRKIYGLYKNQAANDIKTFRDFLSYIAQATCTFATINRAGQLVLREFGGGTAVDTISDSVRLSGAVFEDYETKYNGIFVNDMDTGDEVYYGYDEDNNSDMLTNLQAEQTDNTTATTNLNNEHNAGKISDSDYARQLAALQAEASIITTRITATTLRQSEEEEDPTLGEGSSIILGDNPLLQDDTIISRDADREHILARVMEVAYTPFTCSLVCGAHYDLGDVIEFTNGHAGTSTMCCVMGWEYNLNAENNLEGYGADPDIANVHSLARKKASTTLKDYNDTKVEVTNIYNAKNGTEIAQISVNGDPKSIYERKANFIGQDPIDNIGDIDDLAEKGDLYIQMEQYKSAKYALSYFGWAYQPPYSYHGEMITFTKPADMAKMRNFLWNKSAGSYSFDVSGMVYQVIRSNENPNTAAGGYFGCPIMSVNITEAGTYKVSCDAIWSSNTTTGQGWSNIGLSKITANAENLNTVPAALINFTSGNVMTHYENTQTIDATGASKDLYIWVMYSFPYMPSGSGGKESFSMSVRNLIVEKVVSGTAETGYTTDTDIDSIYTKSDETNTQVQTRSANSNDVSGWKEIKFLHDVKDGLHIDSEKKVCLDSDVMRAWIKADPPQKDFSDNRYCIRYTGDPDNSITITYDDAVGWSNMQKVKQDKEGVYSFKCGGTVDTSTVQYVAYRISGLTVGEEYFFNFKAGFNTNMFGNDHTKGLGIVFSTTSSIDTNSWTGDPHTFNEETLYCSFYRSSGGHFYDFSFEATAATMYMIVTVGDITNGTTCALTMSYFVISKQEKKYIRSFYLYDTESKDWLRYKPFGSGSGDGEGSVSTLGELDDVDLNNTQDGDALVWDAEAGEWVNGDAGVSDYPELTNKPSINSVTLSGNKTTRDLGMIQEITQAEYDLLSSTEKNNPDKVYYIKDGGGSGGGGGGGTTVIANPSGEATDTLNKLQVGEIIYGVGESNENGIFAKSVIQSQNILSEFEYKNAPLKSHTQNIAMFPYSDRVVNTTSIPTTELSDNNVSCTAYAVVRSKTTGGNYNLISSMYAASNGNAPNFFTYSGTIRTSVYSNDTNTGVNSLVYHVLVLAIDNTTKKARYYIDGVAYSGEKSFNNSGKYIGFCSSINASTGLIVNPCFADLIYGAVVLGAETEEQIVANSALIMAEYSDYIGN